MVKHPVKHYFVNIIMRTKTEYTTNRISKGGGGGGVNKISLTLGTNTIFFFKKNCF